MDIAGAFRDGQYGEGSEAEAAALCELEDKDPGFSDDEVQYSIQGRADLGRALIGHRGNRNLYFGPVPSGICTSRTTISFSFFRDARSGCPSCLTNRSNAAGNDRQTIDFS